MNMLWSLKAYWQYINLTKMQLKLSMSVLIADTAEDLRAAISLKMHLLCLGNLEYLHIAKEELKGNKYFTIISYAYN